MLKQQKGAVRAVDIANHLGFSKPTISQYMKQYVAQGLVRIGSDGYIELTDQGRAIAEPIFERHRLISAIFITMGVPEDIARRDACKVEHDLSEETFQCMKAHYLKHIHKAM